MADKKNLDLLRKIKALAERGEPGERESAQKKLAKLMEKYNILEEDLSDDEIHYHEFKYSGKIERKLLVQIMYKVVPTRELLKLAKGPNSRSLIITRCTEAEAIEISLEFEFYKELLEEDLDFFLLCFVQKHMIFPPGCKTSEANDTEMIKMTAMMAGMSDKSFQKGITQRN